MPLPHSRAALPAGVGLDHGSACRHSSRCCLGGCDSRRLPRMTQHFFLFYFSNSNFHKHTNPILLPFFYTSRLGVSKRNIQNKSTHLLFITISSPPSCPPQKQAEAEAEEAPPHHRPRARLPTMTSSASSPRSPPSWNFCAHRCANIVCGC